MQGVRTNGVNERLFQEMNDTPRYLITTADERTWKFDRPVIFLGEWCRIYDRRDIWQNMDAVVAPPYGLGILKKDADHALARDLEEVIFPILCDALNQYHGTHHDHRSWRIMIGGWLRRYIDIIINRVKTLEQCSERYSLSGATTFAGITNALAPLNSLDALLVLNNHVWSNCLYARIIGLLGSCPLEYIQNDLDGGFCEAPKSAAVAPIKKKILRWGFDKFNRLLKHCVRKNDALIINSYLPRKTLFKLQLALRQCPQYLVSSEFSVNRKPDTALREVLSDKFTIHTDDRLLWVISKLLFEMIPISFLEAYGDLDIQSGNLAWPSNPRFIFTSNNFDLDDLFKVWASKKIAKGSRYITGQHGNNYGTYRYMMPSIEEATADKFITWGWSDGMKQHAPAFILKSAGLKKKSGKSASGLLLIEAYYYNMMNTWDRAYEFECYWQTQAAFVSSLRKDIKEDLTIRLHSEHRKRDGCEISRWSDFDSTIQVEPGEKPMKSLLESNRLIVYGYDSTGILETLSMNKPTIAFWENGFEHLRDSAKPYYQLLVDVGIFHLTPSSTAQKINEVWDNLDDWWLSKDVQGVRKIFCEQYAREVDNPVQILKQILTT